MAEHGKQRVTQPAMAYEAVMRRVQEHVCQLETLAHSCSSEARDKALKLSGHIDEALTIAGVSVTRVELCDRYRAALSAVMKPRPRAESIDMSVATAALAPAAGDQIPSAGQSTRARPKLIPIVPLVNAATGVQAPVVPPPDLG